MTDSTTAKVWEIETRPFGDNATITGTATLNLRFPGQYFDAESGLHYNWNRDYNPTIGRYIQVDPVGIKRGMNHLFAYVQGNPITFSDSSGLGAANSFKDFYEKFKKYNSVRCKCKDLVDDKGGLKNNCDVDQCYACTRAICETFGSVGTSSFGACFIELKNVCFACAK